MIYVVLNFIYFVCLYYDYDVYYGCVCVYDCDYGVYDCVYGYYGYYGYGDCDCVNCYYVSVYV